MKTIIFDSAEYELAPKTMAIAKKEDLLLQSTSLEDAYRKQFDYAKLVLGDKSIKAIFGDNNINNIDLSKLTLLVDIISATYNQEIEDNKIARMEKYVNCEAVNKLIEAGNSLERINNSQTRKGNL